MTDIAACVRRQHADSPSPRNGSWCGGRSSATASPWSGLVVTVVLYIIAVVPGFFAINDPSQQNARAAYHPPQADPFHRHGGRRQLVAPALYPSRTRSSAIRQTLAAVYSADKTRKIYVTFFGEGYEYSVFGLFSTTTPSDRLGRTSASRCSCSAPTGSAAASTAASCRARRSRCRSASSACCCR